MFAFRRPEPLSPIPIRMSEADLAASDPSSRNVAMSPSPVPVQEKILCSCLCYYVSLRPNLSPYHVDRHHRKKFAKIRRCAAVISSAPTTHPLHLAVTRDSSLGPSLQDRERESEMRASTKGKGALDFHLHSVGVPSLHRRR